MTKPIYFKVKIIGGSPKERKELFQAIEEATKVPTAHSRDAYWFGYSMKMLQNAIMDYGVLTTEELAGLEGMR